MSEQIKAGDLVYVAREHCPDGHFGKIATAGANPLPADYEVRCRICAEAIALPMIWLSCCEGQGWYPTPWLRRIPPLSELDEVKHDEEITAC